MQNDSAPSVTSSPSALRTTILVLTLAATFLTVIAFVALFVEYFSHVSVWPPLMAFGLWGLPAAFIGLVALVLLSVRDRRRADRRA